MSLQDALAFIQKTGSRPDLQEKLRLLGIRAELEDVIALGRAEGHRFTIEELRTAFVRDWSMRRFFYCADKPEK